MVKYLLELYGQREQPSNDFVEVTSQIQRLARFKSGKKVIHHPGIEYRGVSSKHLSSSNFVYLDGDNIVELESLLKRFGIDYRAGEVPELSLCCEESTRKARRLVFENCVNEPVVCISPSRDTVLRQNEVIAHLEKRLENDYLIDKEIIRLKQCPLEHLEEMGRAPYTMWIYLNREQARGKPGRLVKIFPDESVVKGYRQFLPDGTELKGIDSLPTGVFFDKNYGFYCTLDVSCNFCFPDNSKKDNTFFRNMAKKAVRDERQSEVSVFSIAEQLGMPIDMSRIRIRAQRAGVFYKNGMFIPQVLI